MATDRPVCPLHGRHPHECFLTHYPWASGALLRLQRPYEGPVVEVVVPERDA